MIGITGRWSSGKIDGFRFEVKHFESGSLYGIDGGKISKLHIWKDGVDYACYERGWDLKPTTDEAKAVYDELIKRYN